MESGSADGADVRVERGPGAGIAGIDEPNLSVEVATGDPLDVRRFDVEERIDELFVVRLEVLTPDPSLDFDAIVGRPARFTVAQPLRAGRARKVWEGVCRELSQVRVEPGGLSTYELILVPAMWLLTQRRNHRIFQNLSSVAIARQILGEWGIAHELATPRDDPRRDVRVQYGETDHAFVCRMLEEAGVSHAFRADESGTRLVLSHAPHAVAPLPEPVAFRDTPTRADRDVVTAVRLGQRVRPGRYTLADHDTRLAASYPLGASAAADDAVEARLETFEYAPGALLALTAPEEGTPTADDRATVRSDEALGAAMAQARLAAARGSRREVTFETTVLELGPGVVLSIADHPHPGLARPLLVTASRHHGTSYEAWTHTCEARPADAPYLPACDTPRPRTSGVESATVVGPAGEEIHTDELGRVRVHFHWDRESRMDERSTPWIPVSHAWGGAGYGGTNLPRIGQEVIIDFLGGDPDRPVVIGRIYTVQQKTPYKLPDHKTQSGWKSCSTNQTGGYNEIMFEDAAGRELLRMQAEKDLDKLVKNDERVEIRRDRIKLVKRDDALKVERDRSKRVHHDESISIGHDRDELVEHDERVRIGRDRRKSVDRHDDLVVGGNQARTVQRNQREVVALSRTRMVGLNEAVVVGVSQQLAVGRKQSVKVGKDQSVSVGGKQSVKVKKMATETIGLVKALTVGGAYNVAVGGFMATTVGKAQTEQVGMTKAVTVGESITFTCGRTSLVMEAAGKITLAIAGGARVVLDDKNALVEAAAGGAVVVKGGPEVHLNP